MIIEEMTQAECLQLLEETGFGRLGCARADQPYIVPIYFAADAHHIYGFSTLGKKISWMRANPLVCVEVDEIISPAEWRSAIVSGRYHELPDSPVYSASRNHAHRLLQKRASWWEPAYVSSTHQGELHSAEPIFYQISIDEITGHRAQPDQHDLRTIPQPSESRRPEGWLARWIHRTGHTVTPIDGKGSAARTNYIL